jgi:sorbitol-specific phosphotransferase system component IIBC
MRGLADSMIVGLFVLPLLPGQLLRRVTEGICIALFSLSVLSGCSTQSAKTVETEKTVRYAAETDPAQLQPIVVTETQTTKTEEQTKSEGQSVGLLSGTVHVVGEVIALPFRAVAGLINLVF